MSPVINSSSVSADVRFMANKYCDELKNNGKILSFQIKGKYLTIYLHNDTHILDLIKYKTEELEYLIWHLTSRRP